MISYCDLVERMTKINKEMTSYLIKILKKKNYMLTSMELLLLLKIYQNPESSPVNINNSNPGVFSHLSFLLQSLENKELISISSKGNLNSPNTKVAAKKAGTDIAKAILQIKVPKEVEDILSELEIFFSKINKNEK